MKNWLICLAVSWSFSTSANAADWKTISADGNVKVDVSSRHRDGHTGVLSAWFEGVVELDTLKEASFVRMKTLVKCSQHQLLYTAPNMTYYTDQNTVIKTSSIPDWNEAIPESVAYIQAYYLCDSFEAETLIKYAYSTDNMADLMAGVARKFSKKRGRDFKQLFKQPEIKDALLKAINSIPTTVNQMRYPRNITVPELIQKILNELPDRRSGKTH